MMRVMRTMKLKNKRSDESFHCCGMPEDFARMYNLGSEFNASKETIRPANRLVSAPGNNNLFADPDVSCPRFYPVENSMTRASSRQTLKAPNYLAYDTVVKGKKKTQSHRVAQGAQVAQVATTPSRPKMGLSLKLQDLEIGCDVETLATELPTLEFYGQEFRPHRPRLNNSKSLTNLSDGKKEKATAGGNNMSPAEQDSPTTRSIYRAEPWEPKSMWSPSGVRSGTPNGRDAERRVDAESRHLGLVNKGKSPLGTVEEDPECCQSRVNDMSSLKTSVWWDTPNSKPHHARARRDPSMLNTSSGGGSREEVRTPDGERETKDGSSPSGSASPSRNQLPESPKCVKKNHSSASLASSGQSPAQSSSSGTRRTTHNHPSSSTSYIPPVPETPRTFKRLAVYIMRSPPNLNK